jgi:hypothetical protein
MRAKTLKTWVLLLLAAMFAIHVSMAWNSRDLIRKGYPDFTIFYSAGKILREGFGTKLYDEATQYRVQQEFAAGVSIRQGPLPYNHPPFEALLFVPFTYLPYFSAYLLWNVINLLILCSLPLLLRQHIPLIRWASSAFWLLAALSFFPVFVTLLQGQDTIILLLLLALMFISLKKKADFSAGVWLGLGLFRFQVIMALAVLLLLNRKWKAIAGFLSAGFVLAVISIVLIGAKGAANYPSYLWLAEKQMQHGASIVSDMPNLRGFIETVLGQTVSSPAVNSLIAISSIALLAAATKWKLSANVNLGFSLAIIVAILVSYHSLAHDLSVLFLPGLLIINCLRAGETRAWRRVALLGPMLLLFLSPVEILLLFHYQRLYLLAPVLLLWSVAIGNEMSSQERELASSIVE